MIGTVIEHFEITAKLGQGGMGEVYRAEDRQLGRAVAIKALPEALSADPERLARFEREARTLAALSHPNIAGIHQVAEANGRRFLVMELVEGEDLSARIARGAIPVEEALRLARQIAEALEAAHARGIVHRDLKPANVKILPDGRVKVLDFGLAKALDPTVETGGSDTVAALSHSPTLTANMTRAGMILGTAAYMSPEQARGKEVDRRSDIWSFGVLLYEMLTGRQTFRGDTVTDVIAAIVTREPDWDALPHATPGQVRRLLRQCTRKNPHERLHDVADARIALSEAIEAPESPVERVAASRARGWWAALVAVGLLSLVAGAGLAHLLGGVSRRPPETSMPVTRLSLEVPEGLDVRQLLISRDGRTVAFTAQPRDRDEHVPPRIYVRPLDADEARVLEGTEGTTDATFSPDGRWIAFLARDSRSGLQLSKIAVDGGPSVRLFDDLGGSPFVGLHWCDDDRVVMNRKGDVVAFPMNGDAAETLLDEEAMRGGGWSSLFTAVCLPDPDKLLLGIGYQAEDGYQGRTEVFTRSTGERRLLIDKAIAVARLDRALVFGTRDAWMAAPFDGEALATTGPLVPLFQDQIVAVSPEGTLLTTPDEMGDEVPAILHTSGELEPLPGLEGAFGERAETWTVRWSPDGRRLAMAVLDSELRRQLYTYDVEHTVVSPLGFEGQAVGNLAWSPDGEQIAFSASPASEGSSTYIRSAAGNDTPRQVLAARGTREYYEPMEWSPDGETLLVNRHQGDDADILALDLKSGNVRPLVDTAGVAHSPSLSPDGRWVAYHSDESGRDEVYVTRFDDADAATRPKVRVSRAGGTDPEWAPDGRTLYFVSPSERLMAARIGADDGPSFGVPEERFDLEALSIYAGKPQLYEPHPAGDRFVVTRVSSKRAGPRAIRVVLGWDRELYRKLGVAEP